MASSSSACLCATTLEHCFFAAARFAFIALQTARRFLLSYVRG